MAAAASGFIGGTTLVPAAPLPTGGASPSGNTGGAGIAAAQSLPTGIRVVLTFAPGSGLVGNLTRDSLIAP